MNLSPNVPAHGRRVAIIDGGYASYENERSLIEGAGYTLQGYSSASPPRESGIELARGAEGILVRWTTLGAREMDALPELRAIARYGVGFDNVDVAAATARGIAVSNVTGYANESVTDHALMLLLAGFRGLNRAGDAMRGSFASPPWPEIMELRSATLGIVGLGNIGARLADKAKPLVKRVIAFDPYKSKEHFSRLQVEQVDLDTLLQESHAISLHCNLTPETTHLINAQAFDKMLHWPVLINTARGPVISEVALLDALKANTIRGACLDVFESEPPSGTTLELIQHPRVVSTGHYAYYSLEAIAELQRRAALNLIDMLAGKLIEDCLNPEVLRAAPPKLREQPADHRP